MDRATGDTGRGSVWDRTVPVMEDWEKHKFRIRFFSTDGGATWRVLQHCVEISQENCDAVEAAFRASLNAKTVDTCVVCATKWMYYDPDYSLGCAAGILLKA